MSAIIESFTSKLIESKPIFNVKSTGYGVILEVQKVDQNIDSNDPIGSLVLESFTERFDAGCHKYSINRESINNAVFCSCVRSIKKFYENNSSLKKAKLSKTYNWLGLVTSSSMEQKLRDGMVLLYKYILSINSSFKDNSPEKKEHLQNAMNLIELLRSKHEKQS